MLKTVLIPAIRKDSRRLMLVMHGLGDCKESYRPLVEEIDLPWLNYLLVDAPDEYYGGFSWFDFPGDPTPGVARSFQLLCELLDACRSQDYPTEQTLLFGFSQGGLMTWETGLRYPHRLAGCIGISGFINQPDTLFQERSPVALEQKFLVTHGLMDPLIPCAESKKQVLAMQQAGVRVEWRELAKAHTIDGYREIRLIRDFIQGCFPAGN